MFYIDLKPNPENIKIYELKRFNHAVVIVAKNLDIQWQIVQNGSKMLNVV